MALESYKKEQVKLEKEAAEEAAKEAGTVVEEPEDTLTLTAILANKEQSGLFAKMLEREGGADENKELMGRVLSGKLEADDIGALEQLRGTFSEKMSAAENIRGELTPELAMEMGKSNPEFEKVVKLVGPEKAVSFIQSQMREIAITDPEAFEKISRNMENVRSFRDGDLKKLDGDVREKCKKEGLNADQYMKTLAIVDDSERSKALSDMVKNQWDKNGWGGMKRTLNLLSGNFFSDRKAGKLEDTKSEIDGAFAELDKRKKEVGSVLSASVSGNKDLLEALSREIVGAPKKKEAVVSMSEAAKIMPTETTVQEDWGRHKATIRNWDTMDDAQKDVQRETFLKKQQKTVDANLTKKSGLWAILFGWFCGALFDNFDKKSLK